MAEAYAEEKGRKAKNPQAAVQNFTEEKHFWPLQRAIESSVGKKKADQFYASNGYLEDIRPEMRNKAFKSLIDNLNKYPKFTQIDRENIKSELIRTGHKDIANMIK